MRGRGVGSSPAGLGLSDHLCLVPHDAEAYRQALVAFVVDGLALGARVAYVGASGPDELRADLGAIGDLDELVSTGALRLGSLETVYGHGDPVVADDVIDRYATATDEALADGYVGYRVTADVSSLMVSAEHVEAFALYEAMLDRYMSSHPLSAMCTYRSSLGDERIAETACTHPLLSGVESTFQIFAVDGATLAVRGELDRFCVDRFVRALERIAPPPLDPLVLDVSELQFTDHYAVLAVERYAERHGGRVVMRGGRRVVQVMLSLLPCDRVGMEPVA